MEYKDLGKIKNDIFIPNINRFEVIDKSGRAYVTYDATEVAIHIQDDGKTVKIFI